MADIQVVVFNQMVILVVLAAVAEKPPQLAVPEIPLLHLQAKVIMVEPLRQQIQQAGVVEQVKLEM